MWKTPVLCGWDCLWQIEKLSMMCVTTICDNLRTLGIVHGSLMKFVAIFALLLFSTTLVHAADSRPNILFIAIDDQNDWIGCMGGHPQVKTPSIDALAKSGTLFASAHCQAPLCNPSRSSLLTGLRPSSTGIYGLAPGIREVEQTRQHVTLPQTFTQAGYFTSSHGKIYHDGSMRGGDQATEFNEWGNRGPMPKPKQPIASLPGPDRHPAMDWGVFPERDEDNADWKIADSAIGALKRAPANKPFFIAAGFRLPHVPCFASQKWFDLYPMDDLKMPPVKEDDRADLPKFADFLHWKLPEPRLSTLRKYNEWKPLVRAYLACVSFMDSQVGRLMQELKATGRADNTIIVLWGDHGWHLGEKLISGKNTLWERSTRVPLIFAGPGIKAGQVCQSPVELLDIFPRCSHSQKCPHAAISKATASFRSFKMPTPHANGPPSPRTTKATTASAPRTGATFTTPMAARSFTT
jgi:arylsulfatase A-like enzyme